MIKKLLCFLLINVVLIFLVAFSCSVDPIVLYDESIVVVKDNVTTRWTDNSCDSDLSNDKLLFFNTKESSLNISYNMSTKYLDAKFPIPLPDLSYDCNTGNCNVFEETTDVEYIRLQIQLIDKPNGYSFIACKIKKDW